MTEHISLFINVEQQICLETDSTYWEVNLREEMMDKDTESQNCFDRKRPSRSSPLN